MNAKDRDALLMELTKDMAVAATSITEIQKDLKEHMKRSHQNEVHIRMIETQQMKSDAYLRKHIFAVQVVIGLAALTGTAVSIASRLGLLQ